jgi:hypothetical protein
MGLLIYIVVALIVFSLLYWLINTLAPEPMRKYAMVALVVIAVIYICYLLLGMAGGAQSFHIPR